MKDGLYWMKRQGKDYWQPVVVHDGRITGIHTTTDYSKYYPDTLVGATFSPVLEAPGVTGFQKARWAKVDPPPCFCSHAKSEHLTSKPAPGAMRPACDCCWRGDYCARVTFTEVKRDG